MLTNLFIWTYIPQVLFLATFHGFGGAWVNGAFLVLSEGALVIALLFEAFLVDETLVDVFDAVLVHEGYEDLVRTRRVLQDGYDARKRLGKTIGSKVYSPFSFRQIIEFVLFLPMNFIPVVGVPIFLLVTGYRAGPLQHWRYFKLLELTKQERVAVEKKRRLQYTWFGTSFLALQLVPGLSMLFLLTSAAGSALWVIKLEEQRLGHGQLSQDDNRGYQDDHEDEDDPV